MKPKNNSNESDTFMTGILTEFNLDGINDDHTQSELNIHRIVSKRDLRNAVRKLQPRYDTLAFEAKILKRGVDVRGFSTANVSNDAVLEQVDLVESGVNLNAKRFNDLKSINDRKVVELKQKLTMLESIKHEFEGLENMKTCTSFESHRIDYLTIEIDRSLLENERLIHKTRQYNHMLDRLRNNQVLFDAHMNGMDDTLLGVRTEDVQVRLLSRQMEGGLVSAQELLQETMLEVAKNRKVRFNLLYGRRKESQNASKLENLMKTRDDVKSMMEQEAACRLSEIEMKLLKDELKKRESLAQEHQKDYDEKSRKLTYLEDSFSRICQSIGLPTELNESSSKAICDKITGQRSTRQALLKDKNDVEVRLTTEKDLKEKLDVASHELKAAGVGNTEVNREVLVALEGDIQKHKAEVKASKANLDRVEAILIGLRQGANGLTQRLDPFVASLMGSFSPTTSSSSSSSSQEDGEHLETLVMFQQAESVLCRMMEVMTGEVSSSRHGVVMIDSLSGDDEKKKTRMKKKSDDDDDDDVRQGRRRSGSGNSKSMVAKRWNEASSEASSDVMNMEYNIRIKSALEMNYRKDQSGYSLFFSKTTKTGNNNQAVNNETDDVYEGMADRDLIKSQTKLVQSRMEKSDLMRVNSSKQFKSQDTLPDDSSDAGDKEIATVSVDTSIEERRMQEECAKRMSKHSHPPTLPPGLTLRDDIMVKMDAFLTQLPELK